MSVQIYKNGKLNTIAGSGGGGGEVPDNVALFTDAIETAEATPRDADTLGGRTPEYYAKQSDVSTLNQNLTFDGNYVFRVGLDGDGNPGFYKADDSFSPFSGINEVDEIYSNSGLGLKYNWTPSETQKSTYKYFLFVGVAYTYNSSNNSYLTVTVDGVNPIINITKHNGESNTAAGSRDLSLAIVDSKKTNNITIDSNWKAITYIYGIK